MFATWAIILIAIGFILVFIEIFLIPGFGPVGVLGAVLMAVGVAVAGYREGIRVAVIYAGITIGLALPLCAIGFWLMPKTRLGRSFILSTGENSEAGFKSIPAELDRFIGKTGVSLTPLRPAGIIDIDGVRLDALTRGDFIEKGKEIEVTKIEGRRIIVRAQGMGYRV
jgi:membrane-bound serine protease (ClpP class)